MSLWHPTDSHGPMLEMLPHLKILDPKPKLLGIHQSSESTSNTHFHFTNTPKNGNWGKTVSYAFAKISPLTLVNKTSYFSDHNCVFYIKSTRSRNDITDITADH